MNKIMEQIDYKKKYEEAIERLKQYDREHSSGYSIKERDEFIFPELRESDDEKIRKDIISLVIKWWKDNGAVEPEFSTQNSMIAWLEKQKERSPLSKDEEYTLARIIEYLEDNDCPSEWKNLLHDVYSLPYQKEQKQEWSEEDKTVLNNLIYALANDRDEYINFLKSLRPQKQDVMSVDEFRHVVCYLVQDIVANEHMVVTEKQPINFFVENTTRNSELSHTGSQVMSRW